MLNIVPIPAFQDNYIWLLRQGESRDAVVVDPGDAEPVLSCLREQGLHLSAILITHHHADHTGGIDTLTEHYDVPVYGPRRSPCKAITHPLSDGDSVSLLGHLLSVTEVPGHTLDHICYYSDDAQPQLFCGDTLFLAGCGRLFEGTAEQMLQAMKFFAALPEKTEIYCTHEYSMANLAFARAVEPDNTDIQRATERCELLRGAARPTLPSHIGEEIKINPFLRTDTESVRQAADHYAGAALADEQAVFSAIREWKNNF